MNNRVLVPLWGHEDAPPSGLPFPPLWTEEQTRRFLGLSRTTMRHMRDDGTGPAFLLLGHSGRIRYRPEDVHAWLAAQVRKASSGGKRQRVAVKRGC